MKVSFAREAVASAIGAAVLLSNTPAPAQTVVVQPPDRSPPPAQTAPVIVNPPQQPPAVVAPPAPSPPPASPVFVGEATAPGGEQPRFYTRPNRTLLMTGLVLFGAPYVASVDIAATSSHPGDSNLWVPVLGPWLDIGARGGCPVDADCGGETGNKVLLVANGVLQTVGALEIVGAFVFPETYGATTIATGRSGQSITLAPGTLGKGGYGVSALGVF